MRFDCNFATTVPILLGLDGWKFAAVSKGCDTSNLIPVINLVVTCFSVLILKFVCFQIIDFIWKTDSYNHQNVRIRTLMCVLFETTSFGVGSSCKDILARPDEPLTQILGIKRDPL